MGGVVQAKTAEVETGSAPSTPSTPEPAGGWFERLRSALRRLIEEEPKRGRPALEVVKDADARDRPRVYDERAWVRTVTDPRDIFLA